MAVSIFLFFFSKFLEYSTSIDNSDEKERHESLFHALSNYKKSENYRRYTTSIWSSSELSWVGRKYVLRTIRLCMIKNEIEKAIS